MIENLREAEKRKERKIGKEKRRDTEIETAREIVAMWRRKGITIAEIIDIATERIGKGIGVGIEIGMMVILTEVVTG
jgi:threonyl-tRNA synthetase